MKVAIFSFQKSEVNCEIKIVLNQVIVWGNAMKGSKSRAFSTVSRYRVYPGGLCDTYHCCCFDPVFSHNTFLLRRAQEKVISLKIERCCQ